MASCKLDGELTEFELSGLERHCAGCADCADWMRELGYLAWVVTTSERAEPCELVAVRLLRHRTRRLPALAAASASIGAAFLAAIAIVLPGSSALVAEQPATGNLLNSTAEPPPPRSFVLNSFKRAQQQPEASPSAVPSHGPQVTG